MLYLSVMKRQEIIQKDTSMYAYISYSHTWYIRVYPASIIDPYVHLVYYTYVCSYILQLHAIIMTELILCRLAIHKHSIFIMMCLFLIHALFLLYVASSKQRSSLRKAVAQDKKRIEEAVSQYNSVLAEVQPTANLLTTEDVMQQRFPWSAITGTYVAIALCV